MATKKSTKKPTTTKRTASSKATKKPAAKRNQQKLIGLQPESQDFMTFRITRQSLYWLVLGAVVILFTVWILKLQADIMDAYDRIDANAASLNAINEVKKKE